MMKEIPINLEVLGRMYGLDHLCGAFVDFENNELLLTGYRKETDIPAPDEHFATESAFLEWLDQHEPNQETPPQNQNEARGV